MSRIESEPLVLNETGVTVLRDGTTAVNVGPIVAALQFLTEGRGEDRGTDELGRPLPDLMSLAFDVVQSIILGGRKAEFFRRVKEELDAFSDAAGQSSLVLAKRAERVERPAGPTALDDAADELRGLLGRAGQLPIDAEAASDVKQALDGFRDFGADRWVHATAQLLVAVRALAPALATKATDDTPRRKRSKPRTRREATRVIEKEPAAPPRKKTSRRSASKKSAKNVAPKRRAAPPKKARAKKKRARRV